MSYGCPGYVRIRDAMQEIQIEHEVNRGHRKLTSVYLHDGFEFLLSPLASSYIFAEWSVRPFFHSYDCVVALHAVFRE